MSSRKIVVLSLVMTAAVWAFCSWPLPRFMASGIPSSSTNIEKNNVRAMIQGDHLQLLFNYWLISDWVAGRTPFFCNPYEFNTSPAGADDREYRFVAFDYFTEAPAFIVGQWLGGRALGWNLAGLVSLWLTYLFTWLLLRNYTRSDLLAGMAAVIAIALPFRWTSLLGGSPVGCAMAWVPLLLWGLDSAIRRRRALGGLLAGVAILFAYCNDAHVFYFTMLMAPCWAVLVFLHNEKMRWCDPRKWRKLIVAGLPVALFVGWVLLMALKKKGGIADTPVAGGRSWAEVDMCSPSPYGLFRWRSFGHDSSIYVGFIVPLLLLAGAIRQAAQFFRKPKDAWRQTVFFGLLLVGLLVIAILALGTRDPLGARLLLLARRLPGYDLIRQPAKIFCVLPPLLAVAAAVALDGFHRALRRPRARVLVPAVLAALLVLEYGTQVRTTVCLLDNAQPAYAAVAQDARAAGRKPKALVLPIWPGDSSWASLYEHYVSLYRIRMLNGYQPVPSSSYVDDVFGTFDIANAGVLSDTHFEALAGMGAGYVILHEDAFPEKVSHFPVGFTLKRLLNHPRLQLLQQGRNVWAFKILDAPRAVAPLCRGWDILFPNFHYETEWIPGQEEITMPADRASGSRFIRAAPLCTNLVLDTLEHLQVAKPEFLVRVRGRGRLGVSLEFDDGSRARESSAVMLDDWGWIAVPWQAAAGTYRAVPQLHVEEGSLDLDLLLFGSGHLPALAPGESVSLTAPLFFHAGYTDLQADSVRLRTRSEPDRGIFYGPKLALPLVGRYTVELLYRSAAPAGTALGHVYVESEAFRTEDVPVVNGQQATCRFSTEPGNLPFSLFFVYSRNADMEILAVRITRID